MALPNKPAGELKAVREPEVEKRDVDVLIIGGGMAACGTAFEIKKWADDDTKILLVDKAALERSGAVAQGLSAINTYIGENKPEDYVRMVRNDLMGIVREDLIFDLGRHVDDSVHLFEEWGLPIWKKTDDNKNMDGKKGQKLGTLKGGATPVRTGKWQIMINGESYKRIVAEAGKKALGDENILERVFIVEILNDKEDPSRVAGAVGFSVRENKVYIINAKVMMCACGGAVNIYQPRSVAEGKGRAWYPVWNAGSTYTMALRAGAELSMMENRFTPARFKDGYGPVGAWFLLFKAKTVNGLGENYAASDDAKAELEKYAPYGTAAVTPTCLRNHLMMKEYKEGRGPIIMETSKPEGAWGGRNAREAGGGSRRAALEGWPPEWGGAPPGRSKTELEIMRCWTPHGARPRRVRIRANVGASATGRIISVPFGSGRGSRERDSG